VRERASRRCADRGGSYLQMRSDALVSTARRRRSSTLRAMVRQTPLEEHSIETSTGERGGQARWEELMLPSNGEGDFKIKPMPVPRGGGRYNKQASTFVQI